MRGHAVIVWLSLIVGLAALASYGEILPAFWRGLTGG